LIGVLTVRFAVGPLVKDHLSVPGLTAFITGARPQDGISFPIGPWLAYPLAGFLAARAFIGPKVQSMPRLWMAAAAIGGASVAWLLAHTGASFFRWGSMGIGYFVLSIGVLGATGLVSVLIAKKAPRLKSAVSLRGVSAFLVVPIHYAFVRLLVLAGLVSLPLAAYLAAALAIIVLSFWLSRRLALAMQKPTGASRAVGHVLLAIIVASGVVALIASYSPLLSFGAATIGQIATAASLGRRKTTAFSPAAATP
jgi:hypothetical protein